MSDLDATQKGDVIRSQYPNLSAVLTGQVSGRATEWPLIRIELCHLLDRLAACEAELEAGLLKHRWK